MGSICPHCGGQLELVEDSHFLWLKCRRCGKCARKEKSKLLKKYIDYRARRFDWIGMMAELYCAL